MTNIPEVEKINPIPSGEATRPSIHPNLQNIGVVPLHPDQTLSQTLGPAQEAGAEVYPAAEHIPPVSEPQVAKKIKLPFNDTGNWGQTFEQLQAERQGQKPTIEGAENDDSNIVDLQKTRERLDEERGQHAA